MDENTKTQTAENLVILYSDAVMSKTPPMDIKVYVITDRALIDLFEDNDIEGFRKHLEEDDTIYFEEPVQFETESEALAFCAGLGYGVDERNPVDRLPLRSFEEYDRPYIELIESY